LRFEKKWLQIVGLALSFPSAILFMAWGTTELIKMEIFSKKVGWTLFVILLFNYVFLFVRYTFIIKKKGEDGTN
jgi:hypothetical protein